MSENLKLWDSVFKTPVEETKPITGKAYKGNSPDPYYLIRKATEVFGPCGIGWGFKVVSEYFIDGLGGTKLHVAHVAVWYVWEGKRGEVEHMGGTVACYTTSSGKVINDEDAPKKSVTDALTKALSLIGFAGDIYTGLYDDSKYIAGLEKEARAAKEPPKENKVPTPAELHNDATVDPATGEIKPYRIDIDVSQANDQKVWVNYGQKLIAGISTATSEQVIDDWLDLNRAANDVMLKEAPKTRKRMFEAVGKLRDKLKSPEKMVQDDVPKNPTIAPNARERAEQLAAHHEASPETGELPPEGKRTLPFDDSLAALTGLKKNIGRVGTPEAFEGWFKRAKPAMEVMHPEHVAVLEGVIADKKTEIGIDG